ncbi:MAG TPA: ATP-binding protein [Ideonella sp.]|nr:ATP-binding protein [Ideonella sp.]
MAGHGEIAALIETLHETSQRLEDLTAGEVDAVAARDGRTILLRRAQDQLRHDELAKQTAILNALPARIALLDVLGQIVSVNEAWQRFACAHVLQGPAHGIGVNYLAVCDGAQGEDAALAHQVAEGLRAVLAGSAASYSAEYSCHSASEQHWFLLTVTPLAEGRPRGAVVMHLDVSERMRALQAVGRSTELLRELNADLERRVRDRTIELILARDDAQQASRAKSSFLATMSHEIRTPMNGVIGMVEVLFHSPLPEEQADAVKTIRASAFALLRIIDDILDFSKIEAGRLELERSPVALPELVEGVCDTLSTMALDKHVDLSLFISPQVPAQVWSDPTRLRQVLFNLAGNAIKFSAGKPHRPGRVSMRVQLVSGERPTLVLRVADNGIGMTPQTLAHLFSPFTQGEASTTRRFGGSGLGLTICKRLVTLMSGQVQVQSVLGKGSIFTVTLPIEVFEGPVGLADPNLMGVDCIVAGADETAGDLRVYLEHAGARVHGVADLAGAVQRAGTLARPVVVHGSRHEKTTPEGIRAAFATLPDCHHVLLLRGRRRGARIASSDIVVLDANCLRRTALLRAVAVAAGRASPEVSHDTGGDDPAGEHAEPPTIADARAQGRLLLIAEDDEVNQKVILRQIEILGYAAEMADDGAEALRLWSAGDYALLLTDLHMPDMDGYSLAEAIRKQEAAEQAAGRGRGHMPILALTANALRGEALRARDAGMDEYLTKPMQLHLLKAALAKWLPREGGETRPSELQDESGLAQPLSPIDVSVLKRLIGDEAEVVRDFLLAYQASARGLAAELRAARAAGDLRQIGAIAHKLKSSSRSVGAVVLGDLCAELENACRTGARDSIAQGMAQFEAELSAVEAYVFPP